MKEGYYLTKDDYNRIKVVFHDGLDWLLRFNEREPTVWIPLEELDNLWRNEDDQRKRD